MNRYRNISDFAKAFAAEYAGFMKANGITNMQVASVLDRNDGYVSERKSGKRPLDLDDVDALASLVPGWTGRTLMIELSRRARVNGEVVDAVVSDLSEHISRRGANVGGSAENVDLHEIDVTKLALAATHDTSSVEIDKTPDYENESQDPEETK